MPHSADSNRALCCLSEIILQDAETEADSFCKVTSWNISTMRLLNTKTLQIHEFRSDVRSYAILPHAWIDGEEVTFEDMEASKRGKIQAKARYQKILQCCSQAVSDQWVFIWVDTCCINKQSSAELSEAIKSMYR